MSIKIMSQVWELDLSQPELLVLLVLADHADETGTCWPSLKTVAARAKCSVDGAGRIIQRLTEAGYLEKRRRFQNSTVYRINLEPSAKIRPGVDSINRSDPSTESTLDATESTPGVDLITTLKPPLKNHQKSAPLRDAHPAELFPETPKPRPSRKCPPEWKPDGPFRAWFVAEKFSFSLDKEVDRFKDHTFPATKTDWNATARNWMRTTQERIDRSSGYTPRAQPARPIGQKF